MMGTVLMYFVIAAVGGLLGVFLGVKVVPELRSLIYGDRRRTIEVRIGPAELRLILKGKWFHSEEVNVAFGLGGVTIPEIQAMVRELYWGDGKNDS